ncbi:MAG: hypothetical protein PUJ65_02620 [Prevotellaceae bacterium]|nr:hypothetical protein [Prevotellaceae bacterium]
MYEFVRLGGDYERWWQTEWSGFIVSVKKRQSACSMVGSMRLW